MMAELSERLELAGALAKVVGGVAQDRLGLGGRALSVDRVPGSANALTAEWLTEALCRDVAGARVVGFDVLGGSDGTSSRRVLHVRYDETGSAAGLPTVVFTKSAAGLGSRILLGITGITMGEATFFNDLRPHLDLRSPTAYFAAADMRTSRSIVLMEDLAVRGWSFPDPMSDQVSEQDAVDMIDQMASYHAAFWNGGRDPGALSRLATAATFQDRLNRRAAFARRFARGLERSADALPPALRKRRHELWPAFLHSLELHGSAPETLLHQDLHQGNWLRDPEGRMGLYDWQCVARGHWALDVSYALSAVLATEDRRAWQEDLVQRYSERLRDHGVPDAPSFDQAWLEIRRHPLHGFAFGFFTDGQPRFAPELQPPDYVRRSNERLAAAVDDFATLDALA